MCKYRWLGGARIKKIRILVIGNRTTARAGSAFTVDMNLKLEHSLSFDV